MNMETQKTRLEIIKAQLEEKLAIAIVEAINDGAKVEKSSGGVSVDGVFIVRGDKSIGTKHAVVLKPAAPEIDELFEPNEEDMRAKADKLRRELQEIENKLNSK